MVPSSVILPRSNALPRKKTAPQMHNLSECGQIASQSCKELQRMSSYNKLVRDKIPEIIKADGKECETRVLGDKEYLLRLHKKLEEELREYYEKESIDELADKVKDSCAI